MQVQREVLAEGLAVTLIAMIGSFIDGDRGGGGTQGNVLGGQVQ